MREKYDSRSLASCISHLGMEHNSPLVQSLPPGMPGANEAFASVQVVSWKRL